jgi:hypothetical protein
MYLQRAAFVWVGALLGFLACSTAPTSGTSTSSASSTTTTSGGGSGGTGGMEAGTCMHRDNFYDLCGECEQCLEEKCCPELTACVNEPNCIDCTSNSPDATAGLCGKHTQLTLEGCSLKCDACHSPTPDPGCSSDAGPEGGGTGGSSK